MLSNLIKISNDLFTFLLQFFLKGNVNKCLEFSIQRDGKVVIE